MSILGAIVRTRPLHVQATCQRLRAMPGVDVALNPGDGRLIVLLEDVARADPAADSDTHLSAAEALARIAGWPEVMSTSLVYEYSGADAPAFQSPIGPATPA